MNDTELVNQFQKIWGTSMTPEMLDKEVHDMFLAMNKIEQRFGPQKEFDGWRPLIDIAPVHAMVQAAKAGDELKFKKLDKEY